MNRRKFIKNTSIGTAGICLAGSAYGRDFISHNKLIRGEEPVPLHVQNWLNDLENQIKCLTIPVAWKPLSHSIDCHCRRVVEKIPLAWEQVRTIRDLDSPPGVDDSPRTAYAYTQFQSSIGNIRIDLMWKWYSEIIHYVSGDCPSQIYGYLGVVSEGDRILGVSGQLFGTIYSWAVYGYKDGRNGDTAYWFNRPSFWHPESFQASSFSIWSDRKF